MPQSNAPLDELITVIKNFCDKERSTARGSAPDYSAANQLRLLFNNRCPNLAKDFLDVPDVVYARRIINYGISRKKGNVTEKIWELYFEGGSTQENLAKATDYEARTVKRYIDVFPYEIATQLLEIETELINPIKVPTPSIAQITEQKSKAYLDDQYDLTPTQANILLAFCLHPSLFQNEICDQILFISENTLKTHKKRILKNVGGPNMHAVVLKATKKLKLKFRGDWETLFESKQ
jgi:DNA-binding CsgD family transcriptional regulator